MEWLRLWHDLPTDPKFRTVAKISKQPLSVVMAVYIFLMVDASRNSVKRGVTQCNAEDVSSALDLEIEQVEVIKKAMEGRLLDKNELTGWEKRQPAREDISTERVRKWRESKKKTTNETQCNAPEEDTEEDTEVKDTAVYVPSEKNAEDAQPHDDQNIDSNGIPDCPHQEIIKLYHSTLPLNPQVRQWTDTRAGYLRQRWREYPDIQWWEQFFLVVKDSKFLTGQTQSREKDRPPFVADLEWLIRPTNFVKVIEGKYD